MQYVLAQQRKASHRVKPAHVDRHIDRSRLPDAGGGHKHSGIIDYDAITDRDDITDHDDIITDHDG
ncbi:hypothetical protein D083_3980 [Dickeya solani RNS 08.23.3.1.A]|nr:hypothetical protein D083_3980 [Dickeya solani RNS 08.23.3.1.A]